jgi:hypothetical protein
MQIHALSRPTGRMQDQTLELVLFVVIRNLISSSCGVTEFLQQLVRFLQDGLVVLVRVWQSLHFGHQGETEPADAGDQDVEALLYDFLRGIVLAIVDRCGVRGIWAESRTLLQSDTIRRGTFVPFAVDEGGSELDVFVQAIIPCKLLPVYVTSGVSARPLSETNLTYKRESRFAEDVFLSSSG